MAKLAQSTAGISQVLWVALAYGLCVACGDSESATRVDGGVGGTPAGVGGTPAGVGTGVGGGGVAQTGGTVAAGGLNAAGGIANTGGTGGVGGLSATGGVVDCSGVVSAGYELCSATETSCSAVFQDGAGCTVVCAAAGLACVRAAENIDGECAADETLPAVECDSGHTSDYCYCEDIPTGTGGVPGAGGTSTGGEGGAFNVCTGAPPVGTRVATLYVIGDSTASVYASSVYPRTGWGQVLGDYYSPECAVVDDRALSGRSSKSFYDEGAWTPVRDALAEGDYVLIQFGHNDEKSDDPTRYTDPQTTYKQYLTTYVNDTRAKQATPVLLTSINRNQWSGTTLRDTHGDYPPAVRELATELDVALIDMTALTKTYFERIGEAATTSLFMNLEPGEFSNYPDGNTDNTHLREQGARDVAMLLNADAYRQQLPLATLLSEIPVSP